MKKSLKRVLDQLRSATNGLFRKPTTTGTGLQEPHQASAPSEPTRVQP